MSHTEHYPGSESYRLGFRGRGSLKPARKEFRHMELCYMVSMSVLEEILQSEAKPDTIYTLLANEDTVTVVHFGPSGLINQFAFPIVHRIPDVPEEDGTMMLLVATERSREWQSFWVPLETKLLHCCSLNTVA
jgi:hypothetical protein